MAKYIKCSGCGKRINFGDEVYKLSGYSGLYCSGECFANSYGDVHDLDDELADDCYHTVYDDARKEEIIKEMAEHQNAIEEHRKTMAKLLREFETLTAQN